MRKANQHTVLLDPHNTQTLHVNWRKIVHGTFIGPENEDYCNKISQIKVFGWPVSTLEKSNL